VLFYSRGGWEISHEAWLLPVWSAEGLPCTFGAGSQWLAAGSSGNAGVAARLFSLCIVAWRRLPWARGSGYQVSTQPGASPPPSVALVSQQVPWFTELMLPVCVSQSPFWILHLFSLENIFFVVQKFLMSCSPICPSFL
jgi:hypothetical protein